MDHLHLMVGLQLQIFKMNFDVYKKSGSNEKTVQNLLI